MNNPIENRSRGVNTPKESCHVRVCGKTHINYFKAKPKSLLRASRGKIAVVLLKLKVASAMLVEGLAEATAVLHLLGENSND